MSIRGSSVRRVATLLTLILAVMIVTASVAAADPPGNNGTVKIDGVAFDDAPDNEPHVGCIFQVDFYGFDEGDLTADVTFEAHPPTGNAVLLTDVVFIGEDAAGGGTDLDASVTYDLSGPLAAFEPHPQQGYHVKLTVNAEGSIGADTKHKVFWVEGCDEPEPPEIDLALVKSVAMNPRPMPGEDVKFQITVINQGDVPVENVSVIDYPPTNFSLSGNDDNGWAPTTDADGNPAYELTIPGPIAPGDEVDVFIVLTAGEPGPTDKPENCAEITGATSGGVAAVDVD